MTVLSMRTSFELADDLLHDITELGEKFDGIVDSFNGVVSSIAISHDESCVEITVPESVAEAAQSRFTEDDFKDHIFKIVSITGRPDEFKLSF